MTISSAQTFNPMAQSMASLYNEKLSSNQIESVLIDISLEVEKTKFLSDEVIKKIFDRCIKIIPADHQQITSQSIFTNPSRETVVNWKDRKIFENLYTAYPRESATIKEKNIRTEKEFLLRITAENSETTQKIKEINRKIKRDTIKKGRKLKKLKEKNIKLKEENENLKEVKKETEENENQKITSLTNLIIGKIKEIKTKIKNVKSEKNEIKLKKEDIEKECLELKNQIEKLIIRSKEEREKNRDLVKIVKFKNEIEEQTSKLTKKLKKDDIFGLLRDYAELLKNTKANLRNLPTPEENSQLQDAIDRLENLLNNESIMTLIGLCSEGTINRLPYLPDVLSVITTFATVAAILVPLTTPAREDDRDYKIEDCQELKDLLDKYSNLVNETGE